MTFVSVVKCKHAYRSEKVFSKTKILEARLDRQHTRTSPEMVEQLSVYHYHDGTNIPQSVTTEPQRDNATVHVLQVTLDFFVQFVQIQVPNSSI
jgi:hypothetical protein